MENVVVSKYVIYQNVEGLLNTRPKVKQAILDVFVRVVQDLQYRLILLEREFTGELPG